jgi:hypothetical protein
MASTVIKITYSSVDGAKEVKRFGTVIGASEYARRWIGDLRRRDRQDRSHERKPH